MPARHARGKTPSMSHVRWTGEMTRCLLDYIDELAGNESLFITNRPAALEAARLRLQSVTDGSTYLLLDRGKILNKMGKLADRCSELKIIDLYQKGTAVLDLSKLPANTYSDEEIQAAARSKPRLKLSLKRQSSNVQDQGRNESRSSGPGNSKRRSNGGRTDLQGGKKIKHGHISASNIDQTDVSDLTLRDTRRPRRVYYDEASDSDSSKQADTYDGRTVDDPVSTVEVSHTTRNADRVKKTYVCELCGSEYPRKDLLLEHKSIHTHSTTSIRLHNSSIGIIRLMNSVEKGEHTEVQTIKDTMKNIQADIFDATKQYIAGSRADGNEAIRIELTNCEDNFKDLLKIIFGSGIDPRHPKDNMFPRNNREYRRVELLLSVIGCAVSTWALRPSPRGDTRGGILEELLEFLGESSEVFKDNVEEIAIRRYLENRVQPRIKEVASGLADDIVHLVRRLMPATKQNNREKPEKTVVDRTDYTLDLSTQETDEANRSNSPSRLISQLSSPKSSRRTPAVLRKSDRWPLPDSHNPEYEFKQSMQNMFERALNLRLDMEMKGNAKYRIIFPMSGDFKHEEMIPCNISNNRVITKFDMKELDPVAGVTTNIKVVVPLMPLITGRFRNNRNEPYKQEEIIISESYVHIRDDSA